MSTKELLEKHPLVTEVIREWFFRKMTESIEMATEVPEEFIAAMKAEALTNQTLVNLIDAQPRVLFDVFDDNSVFIEVFMYPDGQFTCKIGNQATTNSWSKRKDSEIFAIQAAFEILEQKLNN